MGMFSNAEVLLASTTNTAGEDETLTTDWFRVGPYGTRVYVEFVNGATAPSTPCTIQPYASHSTDTGYDIGMAAYGGASNNQTVRNGDIFIPPGHKWAYLAVGGNDDQDVAVTVAIDNFTYGAGFGG